MWDFIYKNVFGLEKYGDNISGRGEIPHVKDEFKNPIWKLEEVDDDGSDMESLFGNRSFTVLSDPIRMHQFFQNQLEDMLKRVFIDFGTIRQGSEHETNGVLFTDAASGSLRDQILKPGMPSKLTEDGDLDGKVTSNDVQRFFDSSEKPKPSQPQISFKSVTVRSVLRPDGRVETVRTERDHTGNNNTTTTVTEDKNQYNLAPPHSDVYDFSGQDLFSKLFKR